MPIANAAGPGETDPAKKDLKHYGEVVSGAMVGIGIFIVMLSAIALTSIRNARGVVWYQVGGTIAILMGLLLVGAGSAGLIEIPKIDDKVPLWEVPYELDGEA